MRALLATRWTCAPWGLLCGLLVAASMPPWGWWPLAFVGIAGLGVALDAAPTRRRRALIGWCFAAGWLYPAMGWMWYLSAPGYIVASAAFAGYHALAAAVVPQGRWRPVGRAAAHTVAEAVRLFWPFGGVPLATLPIGQAGGPLLGVARIGGVVGLTWLVFQVGFALAALRRRITLPVAVAVGGCAAVLVCTAIAPRGTGAPLGTLRIAVVQGGGPQGTHAISTPAREVFERHMAATATIEPGTVDAVLWPENIIDTPEFATSPERELVTAEARRLGVPMIVSVTEDAGDDHFLNAQLVLTPDGRIISRYDKVRRVPFGEYMPLRSLLRALGAPTDMVPRDAVAGTDPAVLWLDDGTRIAVAISWEIFFGGRVNEGVEHGGTFVVNPTNGSSYTGTILQTQQIASSRLRAVEQGRWVVQAAPTGFSAFIDPSGGVHGRSAISETRVIVDSVTRYAGRTWYSRVGTTPIALTAGLVLAVLVAGDIAARRRRHIDDDGDGAVVDQLDAHVGPEAALGDAAAEFGEPVDHPGHEGLGDLGTGGRDPARTPPP